MRTWPENVWGDRGARGLTEALEVLSFPAKLHDKDGPFPMRSEKRSLRQPALSSTIPIHTAGYSPAVSSSSPIASTSEESLTRSQSSLPSSQPQPLAYAPSSLTHNSDNNLHPSLTRPLVRMIQRQLQRRNKPAHPPGGGGVGAVPPTKFSRFCFRVWPSPHNKISSLSGSQGAHGQVVSYLSRIYAKQCTG